MDWFQYWYAFPFAILVATLAMTSGFGGGLLFAPFFMLVLKLDAKQAVGIALLTEVFGMGSGTFGYIRRRLIDFPIGLHLLAGAIPGAIVGALLAHIIGRENDAPLKIIFGLGIMFIAILMARDSTDAKSLTPDDAVKDNPGGRVLTDAQGAVYSYRFRHKLFLMVMSFIGGLGSGLVALGGGEINTPQLITKGKVPIRIAVACSVFVMAGTVLAGSVTHLVQFVESGAAVKWNLALMTCSGVVIGGQLGSYISSHLNPRAMKIFLVVLFIGIGMLMIGTAVV